MNSYKTLLKNRKTKHRIKFILLKIIKCIENADFEPNYVWVNKA